MQLSGAASAVAPATAIRRPSALLAAALSIALAGEAQAASPCVQANQEAQELREKGRLREARAELLVCAQKSCNAVVRADCERWLKEVDEQTPTIVVRLVDARGQDVLGARVTIDEARIELDGKPVQVDPGQRTIKARARSGDIAETKVLMAQGEKARVIEVRFTTELAPDGTRSSGAPPKSDAKSEGDRTGPEKPPVDPGRSSGVPVLPLTLAVVGGVALGAFGFFEITGQSAYSDLENGCKQTTAGCSDAEIDPVRSKFVAAGVSLGVSVVAFGAAAILYLTRAKPQDTALRFSPVLRF